MFPIKGFAEDMRAKVIITYSDDPNDLFAQPIHSFPFRIGKVVSQTGADDPISRITVPSGPLIVSVPLDALVDEAGNLYRVGFVGVSPTIDGILHRCPEANRSGGTKIFLSPSDRNPTSLSDFEIGIRLVPLLAPAVVPRECQVAVSCSLRSLPQGNAPESLGISYDIVEREGGTCRAPSKIKIKDGTYFDVYPIFSFLSSNPKKLGLALKLTKAKKGPNYDVGGVFGLAGSTSLQYKVKGTYRPAKNQLKGTVRISRKGLSPINLQVNGTYDAAKKAFATDVQLADLTPFGLPQGLFSKGSFGFRCVKGGARR